MADVKFSELTSLAAADVATNDIFAVVDTSATTSKKLTVANLLGQVPTGAPLHVNDTTDTSSSTTGAISTDGGLGVTLKSFLNGEVTIATGIIADAQDGAYLGKAGSEFSDVFLADGAVLNFGDNPADTTLTHTADTGLTLNSTRKLMFGDSASFIHQSSDGVLTVDGEATIDLNASTAVTVSNDLTLDSAAAVFTMGASPNQVTFTHDATNGVTVGSTKKLMFNDASQFIQGSSATVLSIGATDEIDLTATAVDLNGTLNVEGLCTVQTGIVPDAQDGAYLGTSSLQFSDLFLADAAVIAFGDDGDVTLTHVADTGLLLTDNSGVGTTQLQFGDAGTYIHQASDGNLSAVADGDITLQATDIKVGLASQDANIQALTDVFDMTLKQYDGDEVARIHDGARAATLETGTLDLTAGAAGKGGFGFKRPVYNLTPASDDQECTLTMAHSGSIIMVTGAAHDLDIALPAIAAGDEGWHITIVITTAFSGTNNMEVKTSGDSGDTIHLYSNDAGTTAADVAGGDVVRTQADPVAGTMLKFTCLKGGAAEQWICESFVPSGDSPTVEAAVA
mgnify:CR=1 FL=1